MPASFPTDRFAGGPFTLARYISVNQTLGGQLDAVELADPRWTCSWTTARLSPALARRWVAWWDGLRGGVGRTFHGYDPQRPTPAAYPAGFVGLERPAGGAFDGTASVTSLATPFAMSLGALPAGFALAAGDMVGLAEGDRRAVFRIMADAVADGAGAATLAVEPHVPSGFTADALANFLRPVAIMTPVAGSFAYQPGPGWRPVSFGGIEVVP